MRLVVDANALFSALIKDGLTAELLFDASLSLYAPEFFVEEFIKYSKLILTKTSRTEDEFVQILHLLKEVITVVLKESYSEFEKQAEAVSPDKKDAAYFALALKLKCGIWSNDKRLKDQKEVEVYSTAEIKSLLK
ncbi:MAG TPA: PIN domain-containing protein [Candidatus Nanoarchaeia archaeon]|nr:PIN domain-containing protein [Candidatus Nanoarchaeia archaeon]